MSTITLETTEKLARAPFPAREELSDILQQTVERLQREKELTDDLPQTSNPAALIYAEVFDFLATKPGPEQIVEFAVSSALQERIEDLLEKNRQDGGLTEQESAEMNGYIRVNHLMGMFKTQVRKTLQQRFH